MVFNNLWEGHCTQKQRDLWTQKNWRCSFPCILPISTQIFGFKSSDMHFLPFQYILCVGFIFCIKAARFKALKQQYAVIVIILPSEQEQFGFGGSFLFFDASPVKAISAALVSLCAQQHFCCHGCQGFICWEAGQARPEPSPSLSAFTATAIICSEIALLCPERLCKFT